MIIQNTIKGDSTSAQPKWKIKDFTKEKKKKKGGGMGRMWKNYKKTCENFLEKGWLEEDLSNYAHKSRSNYTLIKKQLVK